jgi:hypothetical protein
MASAAARDDLSLEQSARNALADQLGAQAVGRLGRAHDAGFFRDPAKLDEIDKDTYLDPLRSRGDFQLFRQDLKFPADPFAH